MAWKLHTIEQTQLRRNIASMAWGARNLISTQEFGLRAFYMGASARVALLLVVNSLNELVLKKAWAKDDS